jgi:hypothetical protein
MANRKARIDKKRADEPDRYDDDLERDDRRSAEGRPGPDAEPYRPTPEERHAGAGDAGRAYPQKDRTGQAQSPVEETPNEPPKERHRGGRPAEE